MMDGMFADPLVQRAVDAALAAGREILEVYHSDDHGVELKGDVSPLTKADRAAHEVIMRKLDPTGLPVLSEEGRVISYEERIVWDRFWMVDPLDGTKEFISRNGEFTVNIALIDHGTQGGEPVMGVVYVPILDELYLGKIGAGALLVRNATSESWESEELPRVSSCDGLFRVVGSRSHLNDATLDYVKDLRREHPKIEMLQRGSSLKICMVASGEADCYPRFGPTMEWDTAAGHAIVRSAGKLIVDAACGDELTYNKENLLNPFFVVR
uniref:3'(2'),5'-bisphosphate nucleotidase CysQ n=1 Tax=Chlorobium phaeovibrioides (strain DSM 265 / 1930) TaxID=290318 RepID=A4SDU2_CHLPM